MSILSGSECKFFSFDHWRNFAASSLHFKCSSCFLHRVVLQSMLSAQQKQATSGGVYFWIQVWVSGPEWLLPAGWRSSGLQCLWWSDNGEISSIMMRRFTSCCYQGFGDAMCWDTLDSLNWDTVLWSYHRYTFDIRTAAIDSANEIQTPKWGWLNVSFFVFLHSHCFSECFFFFLNCCGPNEFT